MDSLVYRTSELLKRCGKNGRIVYFAFGEYAGIVLQRLLEANSKARFLPRIVVIVVPWMDVHSPSVSHTSSPDWLRAYSLNALCCL